MPCFARTLRLTTLIGGMEEDAAHNSLQMSSSRDLTGVSEARDLTVVGEDATHNYLQMSCSRDFTDVTLVSEDEI